MTSCRLLVLRFILRAQDDKFVARPNKGIKVQKGV